MVDSARQLNLETPGREDPSQQNFLADFNDDDLDIDNIESIS